MAPIIFFLFQKCTKLTIKSVLKHIAHFHRTELLAELVPENPVMNRAGLKGWAGTELGRRNVNKILVVAYRSVGTTKGKQECLNKIFLVECNLLLRLHITF